MKYSNGLFERTLKPEDMCCVDFGGKIWQGLYGSRPAGGTLIPSLRKK